MANAWDVISSEFPKWWKDTAGATFERDAPKSVMANMLRRPERERVRDVTPMNVLEGAADVALPIAFYAGDVEAAPGAKALKGEGKGVGAITKALRGGDVVKDSASFKLTPETLTQMYPQQLERIAQLRGIGVKDEDIMSLLPIQDKLAREYPEIGPPVMKVDKKKGTTYPGKQLTEEALLVQRVRNAAADALGKGGTPRYFDESQRAYANKANYPMPGRTETDALPKTQKTIDSYRAQYDTPEVRARIEAAIDKGAATPETDRWYAMKQWEDQYIKEFGPVEGPARFRTDFAEGMAATTGGADPTSNFMMSSYINHLRDKNQLAPVESFNQPFPVGAGKYGAKSNMEMANRVTQGTPLTAPDQPKRHNFAANFMGHTDRSTIDEQMMTLFDPSKKFTAPPGDSYGVLEGIFNDVARGKGQVEAEAQGLGWAGAKDVDKGKPMISHINDSIYRTSIITGKPYEEVVRNILRRGPAYGVAAAPIAGQDYTQGE